MKDQLFQLALPLLAQLSPLHWTALGLFFGLASGVAVATGQLYWGLLLFFINRICDGIDGAVARQANKQSDFGGYADLMADFVVYAALPLALAYRYPNLAWYCAALLASFYVNAASWMLLSNKSPKYDKSVTYAMPVGLIEGAETILFYTVFLLFPEQLFWSLSLLTILTLFTAGQRLWWAYRNL